MDSASRTNTAGEKLRVDPDIRTGVYGDGAGKQNLSAVAVAPRDQHSFVSGIERPVDWKGVVGKACSQICEELKLRHQRRVELQ